MFTAGAEYVRRDLHAEYGGSHQSGISSSRTQPLILLFTGDSGAQHGYADGYQPDGTYWYTGEGQVGDMKMDRGNRAIRDAETNGKTMHLFTQLGSGRARYMGQATYLGYHLSPALDRDGATRQAIVFELAIDSELEKGTAADLREKAEVDEVPRARSLSDLRAAAMKSSSLGGDSATIRKANVRKRSRAVRAYVLRRAAGICEACDVAAPFVTQGGSPYLEPHHMTRRADDGPDHPAWVAGICPNCHRRIHYGEDGDRYNEALLAKVEGLEQRLSSELLHRNNSDGS
jgi:5-methylcytosine-specific restriction protein A